MRGKKRARIGEGALAFALVTALAAGLGASRVAAAELEIDLSETPIPFLKSADLPPRVGALIELGRGINEVGTLSPGIELPGGAVWQPALWIYGTTRNAFLTAERPDPSAPALPSASSHEEGKTTEFVTRLDLFANLQLAGTERVFAHVRPLDAPSPRMGVPGEFTGRTFTPDGSARSNVDWEIESLFFEGDFDEMFPNLDPDDSEELDIGIAVGRFPVEFQNGYLVRDEMTGVGLSKTLVQFPGAASLRVLGIWAFDHINETPPGMPVDKERDVDLYGLFIEGDFPWGLLELDVATTRSDDATTSSNVTRGNQFNVGVAWTGHSAGRNYSLHANISRQRGRAVTNADGSRVAANADGELLVAGFSDEINLNHDLFYANVFWVSGSFHRLASNATPVLGPVGLSFAGVGMGSYRPALSPLARDAAGVTLGIQKFFSDELTNWALELAYREDLEADERLKAAERLRAADPNAADPLGDTGGAAITTRLQHKFANRFLVQMDAHYARYAEENKDDGSDTAAAMRVELRMNF